MTSFQKRSIFLLRIVMGWMFLYAGITKVIDPNFSAAGYISGAKNFVWFFNFLLQPNILPVVNFVNEWGLTLLGVALILGVAVRLSSILGAVLMIMYYLAMSTLNFPYPNTHAFIVDEHIIYAAGLLALAGIEAGKIWGLTNWCANLPLCSKYPFLHKLLS